MSVARDGHGTTVTFGTSGFSARLIDVGGPGAKREAIDSTTMATVAAKEFIAAALYDGGELSLTVEHDGTNDPPISSAAETITINWGGSGNSYSFSGFCTGYNPKASIGARMQAELAVKVTGAISY